jgi:hypothetical protein
MNYDHYNKKIQIDKKIIIDIFDVYKEKKEKNINVKMLVFGLGYDSEMWYNMTNKNTFFVEHNEEYINLNKNINQENIIKYDYEGISVENSIKSLKNNNHKFYKDFIIPNKLLLHEPFDIIIIDGPTGYNDKCPGRLLPIYWSKHFLSKEDTIIYVDDSNRKLEKLSIQKFFGKDKINYSNLRHGCSKIKIK